VGWLDEWIEFMLASRAGRRETRRRHTTVT
jgi:hypothetical protein